MHTGTELTKKEIERYSRHLILPEFNIEGQKKLKEASVLVIGSGGLGSPLLLYLAAAGVGHIGIVDFDTIDESNLQRQVLFGVSDVGQSKARTAKKRIEDLNPHVKVTVFEERFTSENALKILNNFDIAADGTDNFATRYLVNDACVLSDKVNVYASIYRFDGQVSVFNMRNQDGSRGPNYRDLYPEPPPPDLVPSCAEGGVLGVLPGIIGSMQASEVIKVITGIGEPLNGRLFLFDALNFETRILKIRKDPANPLNGLNPTQKDLIDYEAFCGLHNPKRQYSTTIKNISPEELKKLMEDHAELQIVDVREPYEFAINRLPKADLIPLQVIKESVSRIRKDIPVVVYCRLGIRSADAIEELQKSFGFTNLLNLDGGINAWAGKIDTEMPEY